MPPVPVTKPDERNRLSPMRTQLSTTVTVNASSVLDHADQAMYLAKRTRNTVASFAFEA